MDDRLGVDGDDDVLRDALAIYCGGRPGCRADGGNTERDCAHHSGDVREYAVDVSDAKLIIGQEGTAHEAGDVHYLPIVGGTDDVGGEGVDGIYILAATEGGCERRLQDRLVHYRNRERCGCRGSTARTRSVGYRDVAAEGAHLHRDGTGRNGQGSNGSPGRQ